MTIKRKWAVIPGFIAVAAAATVLSAYSGPSTSRIRGMLARRRREASG